MRASRTTTGTGCRLWRQPTSRLRAGAQGIHLGPRLPPRAWTGPRVRHTATVTGTARERRPYNHRASQTIRPTIPASIPTPTRQSISRKICGRGQVTPWQSGEAARACARLLEGNQQTLRQCSEPRLHMAGKPVKTHGPELRAVFGSFKLGAIQIGVMRLAGRWLDALKEPRAAAEVEGLPAPPTAALLNAAEVSEII